MRFSYYFSQANWYFAALVYVIVALLILAFINFKTHDPLISGLTLVIELFFGIFAFIVFKKLHYLDKGLTGENSVRKVLKNLPSSYSTLYDVVLDKHGNIDAVVIGNNGIWVIEVKNHKDTAIINDQYLLEALKQPKYGAKRIHDHILNTLKLDIYVQPVMVYANPKTRLNFGFNKQDGVYVIGIAFLPQLFSQHSNTALTVEQCSQISLEIKKFTSVI